MTKPVYTFRTASRAWVWLPVAVWLMLLILVQVLDANYSLFYSVNRWSRPTGPLFWMLLTALADGAISFAIMFPFLRRCPHIVWALLIAMVLFTLVVQGFKHSLTIEGETYPRPRLVLQEDTITFIGPGYRSRTFPSGHSAMSLALAGIWAFHVKRRVLRGFLLGVGFLSAMSRIVVGVHWPLDVLAGSVLGWLASYFALELAARMSWGYRETGQRILGALLLICCVVMLFPYAKLYEIIWLQRAGAVLLMVFGLPGYVQLWRKQKTSA